MAMGALAGAYGDLFDKTADKAWLKKALAAARSALEVFEEPNSAYHIEACMALIAYLEAKLSSLASP
jgi:uncharacterized protein YyaL (SSP411 family)